MDDGQLNPIVVQMVEAPTQETTVADVLIGAVGLVGVVTVAAIVMGLLVGAAFIAFRKLQARMSDRDDAEPRSASPLTR